MKISLVLLVGCFTSIVSVLAQAKPTAKKSDFGTTVLSETGPISPASTPCSGLQAAWLDLTRCSQRPSTENGLSSKMCSQVGGCMKQRGASYLPDVPQLQVADPKPLSKPDTSFRRVSLGYASLGLERPLADKSETSYGSSNIVSVGSHPSDTSPPNVPARPAVGGEGVRQHVQWSSLFKHELLFLSVMNGFRVATEPGTLEGLKKATWGGYFKALGALHGWSDGDGYYETYLGHPIQGAVAGYMWVHHDPKYRVVEFGKSRDYWMSRLRAYAWSFAEIEQFKVGLISEATIGQINRYCCAYGFNDHVITSNGGMVWMVGEDILDRYVIRRIEDHTTNTVARAVARTWLNPVQGFANLMDLEWPWYRENRGPLREYNGALYPPVQREQRTTKFPLVPKFEIAAAVPEFMRFRNLSCLGGGGVAGYRVRDNWQWTLEVSGCTLGSSLPKNWSGDALNWTTGPQWIRHRESRWSPHAHFRVGGQKVTEKQVNPQMLQWIGGPPPLTDGENNAATKHWESTGLSLSMGGGLDVRLHPALAWRFANFDYLRSWVGGLNGVNFDQGFRFSTGVVLRVGTW